ncbi:putative chitinase [Bosea sp. BK604]|nr:putative chitinase [Bosea sp. BK604]
MSGSDVIERVTSARLKMVCPAAASEILEAILTEAPHEFPKAELDTAVQIAHFIAQIAAETCGLGRLDENLHYTTAAQLVTAFGKARFPDAAFAAGYLRSPQKLANYVYAGRNGNVNPDDGWVYRGSGLIQLTGRGNFRSAGNLLGMPLEEAPELCRTADSALAIALAYWRLNKISDVATGIAEKDIVAVTKRINPALQGLDDRRTYFKRARKAFVPPKPSTEAVRRRVTALETLLALPVKRRGAARGLEGAATPPASLSGAHWVSFFPTSRALDDLAQPFRDRATAFVAALRDAGASVTISATLRPLERAYLMHFAWRIAKQGLDATTIPAMAGVPIAWNHPTPTKSLAAARAMVAAYGISPGLREPPSLNSRHSDGVAVDMTLSWAGALTIKRSDGATETITTGPRNGSNSRLIAIGQEYRVIKLLSDPPHWSSDGH